MKTLKIAATVISVIGVLMLIVVVIQPERAHLERTIVIDAPDSVIFPHLSDYRKLSLWWPWPKMDANLQQSYEGAGGTVGSTVIWSGEKAGRGSMVIEELDPNRYVKNRMSIAGQKQNAISEFRLLPDTLGTRIIWTYEGVNDGIAGKAKWVVMGTLLNSQYDLGLKNLKRIIEERPDTTQHLPATN